MAIPQALSTSDLAWLRVQTPENLSLTTVALVTKQRVDAPFLKSRIEDRLMAHRRFRQKIEFSHLPLSRPRWQEVDDFQLADHFAEVRLDESEPLDPLLGHLLSEPLDESRPLWHLHLIQLPRAGSAVILRVHAALADCTAVPCLALELTDDDDPTTSASDLMGFESLISTRQTLEDASRPASATRMLCELITSRADPDNPFRCQITTDKMVAWSDPVDLDAVQKRTRELDCSLTQSLLLAVTGGIRKALHRQDWPAEEVKLTTIVPLNLRREGDPATGSCVALGLMGLPVHKSSASDRLFEVRQQIERLCLAPDKIVVLGADTGRGLSMSEIEERSLRLLGQKTTMTLGLFAGPAQPRRLCAQTITELRWWPALTGVTALGMSIVGYGGATSFGATLDKDLEIEADVLLADTAAALQAL